MGLKTGGSVSGLGSGEFGDRGLGTGDCGLRIERVLSRLSLDGWHEMQLRSCKFLHLNSDLGGLGLRRDSFMRSSWIFACMQLATMMMIMMMHAPGLRSWLDLQSGDRHKMHFRRQKCTVDRLMIRLSTFNEPGQDDDIIVGRSRGCQWELRDELSYLYGLLSPHNIAHCGGLSKGLAGKLVIEGPDPSK